MADTHQNPTPDEKNEAHNAAPPFMIAELLHPRLRDEGDFDQIRELEAYRLRWEKVHGKVDLTKRYATLLSADEQDALFELEPKRYWDALPPMIQDFYFGKIQIAAKTGQLDNLPDEYIKLYMSGQLTRSVDGGKSR
jgi:hypothetical protein